MKKLMTLIIALGGMISWDGTNGVAHANLISNGDFNSCSNGLAALGGTLTNCNWIFANNAGVNNFIGNPLGVDGEKGVRLESSGLDTSDPTASQAVGGLIIGTEYTLSWDRAVRSNTGGTFSAGPSFGVFLDNQSFANALFLLTATTPNSSYVTETVNFLATATTHTFIFAGELDDRSNNAARTDAGHNLDNVSLLQASVPAPGALALFGIGLAGLLVLRRRTA